MADYGGLWEYTRVRIPPSQPIHEGFNRNFPGRKANFKRPPLFGLSMRAALKLKNKFRELVEREES